jgi:hypothetical protein
VYWGYHDCTTGMDHRHTNKWAFASRVQLDGLGWPCLRGRTEIWALAGTQAFDVDTNGSGMSTSWKYNTKLQSTAVDPSPPYCGWFREQP